jgi:hypothetical protein
MSRAPLKERLIDRGLLDKVGRVTPEGEAWTDEQIARLKQGRLTDGR